MARKKAEVAVTCNIRQPKQAQKILITALESLRKEYDRLVAAGKQNEAEAQKMKKDMDALTSAVDTNKQSMNRIKTVMDNLSGSTLKQLNAALREVKRQMSGKSSNSTDLAKIQSQYNAITEQIKKLKGETLDITKGMRSLSTQTDAWLTKAIAKQKELMAQTRRNTQEYQAQKSVLKHLLAEQKRRTIDTLTTRGNAAMSLAKAPGKATMSELRDARQSLVAYRDNIGNSGINFGSTKANADKIKYVNELLKAIDKQIDSINGKEQKVTLTTQQLVQSVKQINFNAASPKQLKAKLDEVNNALANMAKNDPMRSQLLQSAKQLQSALDSLEGRVVNVKGVLANLDKASPQKLQAALDQVNNKLNHLGQNDSRRKALVQQAKQLREALAKVDKEAADIDLILKKLKSTPLADLKKAATQLEQEMEKLDRTTATYLNKREQLRQLRSEIEKANGAVKKQEGAWRKTVQAVGAYMGVTMLIGRTISMITKAINLNLKFSDQLADIRKVSGLAMSDINALANSLAKIDTRTSIEELNQIAYAGAKLGLGKYGPEGLLEFSRAANQVNVALKEDLGADALTSLSKITEVMGLIPKMGVEQSMLATGSAMFQLSATSTATAGNIVEFSKRLTGMARTAGITTDQLLALGSASDAMFLMPEVASTAFNKFIASLQTKHNLIEKELDIEPGTIAKLYEAGNIVDAMVLVFEKMREKGNMNALQGVFKDLGSEGARLVNVMVTMSKNVDILKAHLAISSKAFSEATAVTNEYNIQQETAQALMERASNLWEKAFVNPDGVDNVKSMAEEWYKMSDALTHSTAYMGALKAALWMVISGIKALVFLLPILLSYMMIRGAMAAWSALGTAVNVVRNALTKATAAQRQFNAATKANVFAAVLSVFVAIGVALFESARAAREAAKEISALEKVESEVGKELSKLNAEVDRQKENIEDLISKIHDENTAEKDRLKYIKMVKDMWDEYNVTLDKQGRFISDNSIMLDDYITKLRQAKIAEMSEGKLEAALLKQKEAEYERDRLAEARAKKREEADKLAAQQLADVAAQQSQTSHSLQASGGGSATSFAGVSMGIQTGAALSANDIENTRIHATDEIDKEIEENDKILDEANEEIRKWTAIRENALAFLVENPLSGLDVDAADKDAEKEAKRLKAEEKRRLQEELRDIQDTARAIIDNIKNFYQRQITQILQIANEQNWDEALTQSAVDAVLARQNLALSQARKGIAGVANEWDEFKQTMIDDMIEPADEIGYNESQVLLDFITTNDLSALHDKINGLADDLGLPANAATDAIWKNATLNEKANETARQRHLRERQKLLLEDNYTAKVDSDYSSSMTRLGFFDVNEEQAQTLVGGGDKAKELLERRNQEIATVFQNAREHLTDLIAIDDVTTDDGRNRLLELIFGPNWDMDESELKEVFMLYGEDLRQFYDELIKYDNDYLEAQKKAEDRAKKLIDFQWERSSQKKDLDEQERNNDLYQKGLLQHRNPDEAEKRPDYGVYGNTRFVSDFGVDPEVEAYRLKIEAAKAYYDFLEAHGATAQQLREQEKAVITAQSEYVQHLASRIKKQMDAMLGMHEPIENFGTKVGEAFALMTEDAEAGRKALKAAVGDMINDFMKQTVEMTKEYIKRRIMQKVHNRLTSIEASTHDADLTQIQTSGDAARLGLHEVVETQLTDIDKDQSAERQITAQEEVVSEVGTEAAGTGAKVSLGIAGGAAKTIGALGWWGIPLVAVISMLLNGLLSFAMSKVSSLFGGKSVSDSGAQTKLVSGMLTYDSGNVQAFRGVEDGKTFPVVGSDGKVYAAKDGGDLSTGLVEDPITTLVNGQPALVAERGPEMVIGRETTAAMMMARPDILAEIVKFDRQRSGRTYRAYDSGNIDELQLPMPNGSNTEDMTQLRETIDALTLVLSALQRDGIPAHINKYGRGGVAETARSGGKFMQRNSGDPLWRG